MYVLVRVAKMQLVVVHDLGNGHLDRDVHRGISEPASVPMAIEAPPRENSGGGDTTRSALYVRCASSSAREGYLQTDSVQSDWSASISASSECARVTYDERVWWLDGVWSLRRRARGWLGAMRLVQSRAVHDAFVHTLVKQVLVHYRRRRVSSPLGHPAAQCALTFRLLVHDKATSNTNTDISRVAGQPFTLSPPCLRIPAECRGRMLT